LIDSLFAFKYKERFKMVKTCSICQKEGHVKTNRKFHPKDTVAPPPENDKCTRENVTEYLAFIIDMRKRQLDLHKKTGVSIRWAGMPEIVSEGIIKFVIINILKDTTCVWAECGDLYCQKFKKTEVKSYTTDAPGSCGPTQCWDTMFLLDATKFLEDKYIVYMSQKPSTDPGWKNMKITKTSTKEEKSNNGNRPRMNWTTIKEIKELEWEKVYEGTFEDIFTPSTMEPACQQ